VQSIIALSEDNFKKVTEDLRKQIAANQTMVFVLCRQTRWTLVEEASKTFSYIKVASAKISQFYFKLAKNSYYRKDHQIAEQYWKDGLKCLQTYCQYPHSKSELNYQYWFDISTFYAFRIQLHERRVQTSSPEERIKFIQEGLAALNKAIQINPKAEALFQKFMLLQGLQELGVSSSELPTDYLRRYLDQHEKPFSDEYLEYAQIYGGELAKQKKFQEAKEWFSGLIEKKPHPLVYLCLGKVEDDAGDGMKALENFEQAIKMDRHDPEIQLWSISQRVKNTIHEMQGVQKLPSLEKIKEIVEIFNQFCTIFSNCVKHSKRTASTFISLHTLMDFLYASMLPEMANLLAKLQQFRFSLHLYETILESFDAYVKCGLIKQEEKVKLHNTIGGIYLLLKDFTRAEEHLKKALELDKTCPSIYQNLVAVYASIKKEDGKEDNLSAIWKEFEPLTKKSPQEQKDVFSNIFLNFAVAYAGLGIEEIETAKKFCGCSLEADKDNWNARLLLARMRVITNNFQEARVLLDPESYQDAGSLAPFGESSQQNFQFYFCLSGISALLENTAEADKWAIEAGKTRFNPKETGNLQSYLRALKGADPDKQQIFKGIQECIRKIEFDFRIGKFIDVKNVSFDKGVCVGYHGTTDICMPEFQKGIELRERPTSQFKGKGFYIAKDAEIACYFAMKKAKNEGKGKPVLLKIYAACNLVGKIVSSKAKLTKEITIQYDFLQSIIDGFENFSQYYVFENNLEKIKVGSSEEVAWTEEDYEKFLKEREFNCRC
jgi:tetratricopeptide (TPR) repeat protein